LKFDHEGIENAIDALHFVARASGFGDSKGGERPVSTT
jgi:hypothetical protein